MNFSGIDNRNCLVTGFFLISLMFVTDVNAAEPEQPYEWSAIDDIYTKAKPRTVVCASEKQARRCFAALAQALYDDKYSELCEWFKSAEDFDIDSFQEQCRNYECLFEGYSDPPGYICAYYNHSYKLSEKKIDLPLPGDESKVIVHEGSYDRNFFTISNKGSVSAAGTATYYYRICSLISRKGSVVCHRTFLHQRQAGGFEGPFHPVSNVEAPVPSEKKTFDVQLADEQRHFTENCNTMYSVLPQIELLKKRLAKAIVDKLCEGKELKSLGMHGILKLFAPADEARSLRIRTELDYLLNDNGRYSGEGSSLVYAFRRLRACLLAKEVSKITSVVDTYNNELSILKHKCLIKILSYDNPDKSILTKRFSHLRWLFYMFDTCLYYDAFVDIFEEGYKPDSTERMKLLGIAAVTCNSSIAGDWHVLLDHLGIPSPKLVNEPVPVIDVTVDKDGLRPDGKSVATITVKAFSYRPGDPDSRKPLPGIVLQVRADEGSLDKEQLTLDSTGQGMVAYTAPCEDGIGSKCEAAAIYFTAPALNNLEEKTYISFIRDKGKLNVLPHYKTGVSHIGITPADKHFPADIRYTVTNRDGEPVADKAVVFRLISGAGVLSDNSGKSSESVTVLTDSTGLARCRFRYTGPSKVYSPSVATIVIESESGSELDSAVVESGIDLAIANAVPHARGLLSAGEKIPLAITVYDRFHRRGHSLRRLLNYWKNDDSTGEKRLFIRLRVRSAGNIPKYLSDLAGLYNDVPLDEFAWPASSRNGHSEPLMIEGAGHMSFPQVMLSSSGQNLFDIAVSTGFTGDGGTFHEIGERWPVNNRGFVVIPADVRADAAYMWFVNNPFSAGDKSSKVLRALASLSNAGDAVLNISDAITALNRGDIDDVTAVVVGAIKSKDVKKYADKYSTSIDKTSEALITSAAVAYSQTASAMHLLSAALDKDDCDFDSKLTGMAAGGVLKAFDKEKRKIVLIKGGAKNSPVSIKDRIIPIASDRVTLTDDGDNTIGSVCAGDYSLYCLPMDTKINCPGNSQMRVFHR